MESIQFTDLIGLLEAEYQQYLQLKELADQKKEAIIDNNVDSLADLIADEEDIINDIQDMEDKRKTLTENMARQQECPVTDFNFNNIIEVSPENIKSNLINMREKLLIIIDNLHDQNQQNRMLLEEAMKLNKFSLNVMMKFLEPDSNTYNQRSGKKEREKIVHIVDRKG